MPHNDSNQNSTDMEQDRRILALEKGQEEMLSLLRPISQTYSTVSLLGKWSMGFVVFISVLITIILGIKSIK